MDTLTLLENEKTACTLSPEDLAARVAWVEREIRPHLRHEARLASGFAWELEDAPGLAEKLDRWAELESRCCAEFVFARVPSDRPGHLRLEIRSRRTGSRWRRLARLGGVGALATAGVCCGLPLFVTALANGASAAALARLHPAWAGALGLLSLGAGLAWWRRRRAPTQACGCSRSGSAC